MTKDEILALGAGREMDEAVATRVMGWTVEPWSDEGMGGHNLHDSNGEYVAKWDAPPGWKAEWDPKNRWSPSTDWNAMATVIEKLQEADFIVRLWSPNRNVLVPIKTWRTDIWKQVYKDTGDLYEYDGRWEDSEEIEFHASANTLPLAVCRAALLAVAT